MILSIILKHWNSDIESFQSWDPRWDWNLPGRHWQYHGSLTNLEGRLNISSTDKTRFLRCGQSRQITTYSLRHSLPEYFTVSGFQLQTDPFCFCSPIKFRSPSHLYHFMIIRIFVFLSNVLWMLIMTTNQHCFL